MLLSYLLMFHFENHYHLTYYIKGNGCLNIITAGNYVQLPAFLNLYTTQTTTGLSVAFWAKISSAGSYGKLMYFGNYNTGVKFTFQRERTNNGLFFVFTGGTSTNFVPSFNPFSNIWFHVVWTISTSGYHNIYLNGVLQSLRPNGNFTNGGDYSIRRIGAYQSGDNTIGRYDDFRIYDFALTSNQVSELYNGRVSILSSNINLIYSNVGIGTSSSLSNDYLTINGDLNITELKIKGTNISNFLITSNVFDQRSNQIIDTANSNASYYGSTVWTTNYPTSSIFLNLQGNVGLGSINPKEKLDINGNLNINGNILPNSCNSFDIGSSNFKWKDINLS